MITRPSGLLKYLENLDKFLRVFGVHRRNEPRANREIKLDVAWSYVQRKRWPQVENLFAEMRDGNDMPVVLKFAHRLSSTSESSWRGMPNAASTISPVPLHSTQSNWVSYHSLQFQPGSNQRKIPRWPGARFSKLPVITGPVKLFCFPFQMLKINSSPSILLMRNSRAKLKSVAYCVKLRMFELRMMSWHWMKMTILVVSLIVWTMGIRQQHESQLRLEKMYQKRQKHLWQVPLSETTVRTTRSGWTPRPRDQSLYLFYDWQSNIHAY